MIIILEGPDGAGKSTLARQLSEQMKCHIVWSSTPRDYHWELENLRKHRAIDVIFDRSWYSEMVYGQVWRPQPLITPNDMYALEDELIKQNGGGLLIYCTGDRDEMYARRERTHNDEQNTPERYQRICQLYDTLMYKFEHKIPVLTHTVNAYPKM